jgi:hypothetical protein
LKVSVTVVKRAAGICTATPSQVSLSDVPRLVRLADQQNRPVVVEGVTAGDPAVSCHWAPGPENQATLKLQVDRTQWNGTALDTEVRVQIGSPVREVVTIPVRLGRD